MYLIKRYVSFNNFKKKKINWKLSKINISICLFSLEDFIFVTCKTEFLLLLL